jgi:opacity protein-like surface antigen
MVSKSLLAAGFETGLPRHKGIAGMGRLKTLGVVPVAMLAIAQAAAAADLPPLQQWPAMIKAPVFVEEYSSGVYVRTDGGFRLNKLGDVTAITAVALPLTNNRIDDSWTVGAGFGYKAGWLRADVTVDGARAAYKSDNSTYFAKIESYTTLANGYIDLGTWSGITPYIGAGAGVAYLRTRDSGIAVPPAKWKSNFAWAYGGGVSYGFSPKFLIDLNYRHLAYGDVSINTATLDNHLTIKDLSAHEFRAGLRYVLD